MSDRNPTFSISAYARKTGLKLSVPSGKVKLKTLLEALEPREIAENDRS